MQKQQKLTMKHIDRYVMTESPASSVLELGFCLILAGGFWNGYCKPCRNLLSYIHSCNIFGCIKPVYT